LSADPLIRVENVSFSYNAEGGNPIHALNNVTLQIQKGEYLVIVGHNGSGKSTLAKHLNALLTPTAGDVWVNGWNTKDKDHTLDVRKTVGMVFQIPDNQIVATIVEEDVAFGPENLGVPREILEQRVTDALAIVGLEDCRKRAPHMLSAGQKQRVAIAGIIAMEPACIVLDESTAFLDPVGRDGVLQAVRKLHQKGTTVVAITHFMHEAVEGERVAVMDHGQIVMQGTPREVFSHVAELQELQLDVPQVTALSNAMHRRLPDFPWDLITVDEVVSTVQRLDRRGSAPRWP